jgi:hypothetical protein
MDLAISTYIKLTLIGLGIAIGFYREPVLTAANRLFWIFLIVAFACEVLEYMMAKYFKMNFPLYHVFRPLYYVLYTMALSTEMGYLKKTFLLSIPLVILAAFVNGYYFQSPIKVLNTVIISLTSVLLILQVLFYIAFIFEKHNWQETIYNYSFWIAMGLLMQSITSFLTMGIYNFLEKDGQEAIIPYLIVSEWIFYSAFILNLAIQKHKTDT